MLFLVLSLATVVAADREAEMFTKGYEYLLSFNPDRAAETFRAFLREFPKSSARDAAQFWLGKALIALGSYGEAHELFLDLERNFPESPFLSFVDDGLAEIAEAWSSVAAQDRSDSLADGKVRPANEREAAERDRRITQITDERDRMRALLEDEKKAVREQRLRIADLEAREAALKIQSADAEAKLQQISGLENSLRQTRDEWDRLFAEAETLRMEKISTYNATDLNKELPNSSEEKQQTRDDLLLKVSELERQVWQKEAELSEAKIVQENMRREVEQERKKTDALRSDIARLSQIELIFQELWHSYEEVISDADRVSAMQRERTAAYEERKPDAIKAVPEIKESNTISKHISLPTREQQESRQANSSENEVLLIRGKEYTIQQLLHAVAVSKRTIEKLGIPEPIWRKGNPLDDFINEQLISEEAARSNVRPDDKEYQEMVIRYRLTSDEADYLKKLINIGNFIDKTYKKPAPAVSVEILTVNYQNGSSSQKMVTAADLQKASRSGMSFEDIQKTYGDSVKFSCLSGDEFRTRYKDGSQIIEKLNYLNEETAVIWSEDGFMVIKPMPFQMQFNPFTGFQKEEEEEIRAFLSGHIAKLREGM